MKDFFNLQLFATKISLTSGNDTYSNQTANKIVYALGGNDSVENYYKISKVTIFGGAGNDSITNYSDKVKMSGDAGKDYIYNSEANTVTIDGGVADDKIQTRYSDNVTIIGGKGNDSIQLGDYDYIGAGNAKNSVIKYASGDGNDTIFGFDSNDTLHITSGTYKTSVKGNDFIVTVGKQKIILKNSVGTDLEKVIIKNSKGKLDIYQDWKTKTVENATISANNVTIKAPKAGSNITNYGDKVKFVGNNGVDTFFNSGNKVTISGGNGKDSITSDGNYVSISGGASNDEIISHGDNSTIIGGKGNDFIDLGYIDQYSTDSEKTVIEYATGDGNDTIRGFNSDDTLYITKGTYSTVVKNSDVILNVGKGSILLKDAAGQKLSIKNASGKVTTKMFNAVTSLTSGNDIYTNSKSNSVVYALAGNDHITARSSKNVTLSGGAGNDFIEAFGSQNVFIAGGSGKDEIYFGAGGNYRSKNISVTSGDGNDSIACFGVNNNATITAGKGNDSIYIEKSYSKNNLIRYASGDGNDTIFGFDSNDTLQITSGKYSTLKSGTDFIVTVGKQKIILKDAVNDEYDKIHIKNSSGKVATYNDWTTRKGTSGRDTFDNTANKVKISLANGDDIFSNFGDQVSVSGGNGNDIISSYGNKTTIVGGEGADGIFNYGDNVKISGGNGNDNIENHDGDKVSINGGAGNDTIVSSNQTYDGNKTNTIIGGAGNDRIDLKGNNGYTKYTVQYNTGDGKDTIVGFTENDILIIDGKVRTNFYTEKNRYGDFTLKVGKGSIFFSGGVAKTINSSSSSNISSLLTSNNFSSTDNLSSIVQNNSASADYKIETNNFKNLANENNLLTYSTK